MAKLSQLGEKDHAFFVPVANAATQFEQAVKKLGNGMGAFLRQRFHRHIWCLVSADVIALFAMGASSFLVIAGTN